MIEVIHANYRILRKILNYSKKVKIANNPTSYDSFKIIHLFNKYLTVYSVLCTVLDIWGRKVHYRSR